MGVPSTGSSCGCLAHQYGNAGDHAERERRYPSDMTEAAWAGPGRCSVPGRPQGRGGRPDNTVRIIRLLAPASGVSMLWGE